MDEINDTMLNKTKVIKWEKGNQLYDNQFVRYFINLMNNNDPLFFSRIGGSDYDEVVKYFANKQLIYDKAFVDYALYRVKSYNGYFDFKNNMGNFKQYLENMISYYKNSDDMSYCGDHLINQFLKEVYDPKDELLLNYILENKTAVSYQFIEYLEPFLRSFKAWGKDKTILIISPLSKSIEYQFERRDQLFADYEYPDFRLKTYNTKITYNTNADSRETLRVTTSNWHEECERMAGDISKIDFDIAFLSCASYSMYLGNHIKYFMKKKAIYLGGILNVYFNIHGGRFANRNCYNRFGLNPLTHISALENKDIELIHGGKNEGPNETLNAYFGYKK